MTTSPWGYFLDAYLKAYSMGRKVKSNKARKAMGRLALIRGKR